MHHIDEVARVVVTDFIAHRPLQTYPGGPAALVVAIGALLARLQEGPVFPHFVDYPDIVGRLFAHVRRTGLFADGLLDAHFERLGRISQAYAGGLDRLVASHNDLIPGNILFDGQRLWLIDWESAYRNDPLVDVATVLDTLATAPALEAAFLRAWLGRAPDADLLTRLELTRADAALLCRGHAERLGGGRPRCSRHGPVMSKPRRLSTGDRRRTPDAGNGRNPASPGQDVPCVVPDRCRAAGVRARGPGLDPSNAP